MKRYRADLHIHSCLSPCASLDMSPKAIVERSVERGIDLIALCDHNSAENAGAVMRAGEKLGLRVLPGLEINSEEEVHTLAIFDTEEQALAMQEILYAGLEGSNRPDVFGDQVVANEFDEVEGFNDRMLIGAVRMGLHEVVREIRRLGGLSVASHVDRPSYSVLGQLGFIPEDLELDAVEVSSRGSVESVRRALPGSRGRAIGVVTSSDAHELDDIGSATTWFLVQTPEVVELGLAFRGDRGRRVEIPPRTG
ncbi:MAG: PHP domain-containing protein [Deltaproteobacteria bacterium]|nr:PHP domain-containing protein [Deltaproteobacteria bacterium]